MEKQEIRTNSIGTRDWLKATEHVTIGDHVVNRTVSHRTETQTHALDFDDLIDRAADSPVESTSVVLNSVTEPSA